MNLPISLKKIFLFTFLVFACGNGEDSLIKKIDYRLTENSVGIDVEFNSSLELNMEATIPIKKYGSLTFSPAGYEKGFVMGFALNYKALEDDEILRAEKTRLLPNGQPLSRYITEDLLWVKFKKEKEIRPSLYLGSSMDNFYLGASLELGFMSEYFPTITQWIRDAKGRVLGVITFYGPKMSGDRVVVPGGVFFATNVTHLIAYAEEDEKERSGSIRKADGSLMGSLAAYTDGDLEIIENGRRIQLSRRKLWRLVRKLKKAVEKYNKKYDRDKRYDRD